VNEILLSKVVSASRRRPYVPMAAAAAAILAVVVGLTLIPRHSPAPAYRIDAKNVPQVETPVAAAPKSAPVETPKPSVPTVPDRSTLPLLPEEKPAVVKAPEPVVKPATPEEPPKKPASPTVVEPTSTPAVAPAPLAKENPRETPPADVKTLAPVFVLDPAGDLWLKRDESEAKAGTREKAAWKDWFAAKNSAASFTLEARTSVMLEKGAEAAFSHLKSDDSYSLALDQGLVMLDTEGSSQKWQISFPNKGKLSFSNLNGRLAVQSRGERMSALLLDGSAEMKLGALAKKAQIGEEIVLSRGGQVNEEKAPTQRLLARLDEIRPKVFTAFSATFDEKNDEIQPYPYGVVTGKRVPGPSGLYLQSESIPAQKPGEKNVVAAEVHLDRPFGVVSGMVLRFRYRTTLPTFSVKIGKYSADVASRLKAGQWADAEIPLQAFSFEGTPMLPTDPVENVRFTGSLDRRSGQLDIDGVQFLRRVR
jgi:hypothetical protein